MRNIGLAKEGGLVGETLETLLEKILLAKGYFSPSEKESTSTGESALDVLKKRYARGEISKEEFEEKKRDLI